MDDYLLPEFHGPWLEDDPTKPFVSVPAWPRVHGFTEEKALLEDPLPHHSVVTELEEKQTSELAAPILKKSRTKLTAEERLARQRERNRLAQIRYRARRKEVGVDLAVRHAELAAALASARTEATAHAARERVLDSLLVVRDLQIGALRRGAPYGPAPLPPCARVEPGVSPGQTAVLHGLCDKFAGLGSPHPLALASCEAARFAALETDIIAERWDGIRRTVVAILTEIERVDRSSGMDSYHTSSAAAGVEALERHLEQTLAMARVLKWRIAHYMRGRVAEVRRVERRPTSKDWEGMVTALGLTRDQAKGALRIGLRMRRRVAKILRDRAAILEAMPSGGSAPLLALSNGDTELGLGPTQVETARSLQLREAVNALEANLRDERAEHLDALGDYKKFVSVRQACLVLLFRDAIQRIVYLLILSLLHLQQARVVMLAWPFGSPDVAG